MSQLVFAPTGFVFGARSRGEMAGVHPELVAVAWLALALCECDFGFYDGVRTLKQQQAYVDAGTSWRLDSFHLTGDAMDLVPWVDGQYSWRWEHCLKVARAVHQAGRLLGIPIIWGAVWDQALARLNEDDLMREVQRFEERSIARGEDPKIDGVHFQRLTRSRSLPEGWAEAA